MHKAQAKIDFRVNDRFSSVRAVMSRMSKAEDILRSIGPKIIEVDLSRCDYLGPDGASLIARLCLLAKQPGVQLSVLPPKFPADLRTYWKLSGLNDLCLTGQLRLFDSGNDQRVLPLRQIMEARFTDANPVISLIKSHQNLSTDIEEYLRICINEVLQNVQDHSDSSIGAIMTGQYMGASKQVRIAIVDGGRGICSTLKTKYPETTPELALRRVEKGGYSAQSRINNMGLGISNLCNIVSKNLHGDIFLVSDKAAMEVLPNRQPNIISLEFPFNGTGVFFTLPVDN